LKLADLLLEPRAMHFVEGPLEAVLDPAGGAPRREPDLACAEAAVALPSKALVVGAILQAVRLAGPRFASLPEGVGIGWDALFDVLVDSPATDSEGRSGRRVLVLRGIDQLFAERPLDAGRLVELLLDVAAADAERGRIFRVLYVVGEAGLERQMKVSIT
jgi:hypothetical protein